MGKPNKEGLALLQAKHFYDEIEISDVEDGGGFTVGKDTITIKVNRLAWGYFEQTLLKALKDREDLREWSPNLFNMKKHEACNGLGKFPYATGTKEYDDIYYEHAEMDKEFGDPVPPYGVEIAKFCSECQGTGYELKTQPELKEPRKSNFEVFKSLPRGVLPS